MRTVQLALTLFCLTPLADAAATKQLLSFQRQQLTPYFWAEGSAGGDINRDGHPDVVYGPFWFAGPSFRERHEYRPATATFNQTSTDGTQKKIEGYEGALGANNAYSDNFFTWTYDFNGDEWTDIFVIGMPGEPCHWFENPQGRSGHWPRHTAFPSPDNESPTFTDLTGDGRPELVCNANAQFGYATPDWKAPTQLWTWHPVTPERGYHRYTHGLGVGDVNGDGRRDLLEKDGWWKHPPSLDGDPLWQHHPFVFSPPTDEGIPVGGAQMFAYDVNGDALNDVITCFASHGYWLVWWEQLPSLGENPSFKQHTLTGKTAADSPYGVVFSQPHAIELVDLNSDGLQDILVGKRFWAHGPQGDVEPNAPAVLYWFELVRGPAQSADFVPWLIDDNSGVGTQVSFHDLNGDELLDVITGNKKGAHIFLQKRRSASDAEWKQRAPRPQ